MILRQVYIYKGKDLLYYRHFGKALKKDVFNSLVEELRGDALAGGGNKVQYHDYYKYRVSYITEGDLDLIFLFVTGLTDNFDNIKKELTRCKKEFLNLFEDILHHRFDAKTFEIFDPTIDSIHRNLRPKISLVGFSGVGKTTITRLIKAEEIPMQHIPTITGDIATIKIGKLHFHLWDFAGQEQFSYLWNNFVKGSDAILLITDSSIENVEKSKFFLELVKERAPHAHVAVIGNKQDLEESMKPDKIEKILGLKTYSMIATDPGNRNKMIQIIADILEMSAEVSPLLKPLLERDKLTEEATEAVEEGDFAKASLLFEKISDLCIELGDDSLGREFYDKAQKIKSMLAKVGAEEPPTSEEEIKEEPSPPPESPKPSEAAEAPATAPEPKQPTIPSPPPKGPSVKPALEKPKVPQGTGKEAPKPKLEKATEVKEEPKEEEEAVIKPKVPQTQLKLQLRPEDFMVKQRPKSIGVVPKDARTKLKTSPFAHVTNPTEPIKPSKPVSPSQLMASKPQAPSISTNTPKDPTPQRPTTPAAQTSPTPQIKTTETPKPPSAVPTQPDTPAQANSADTELPKEVVSSQQKENLKQTIMDLKIKKANIQKMGLDFDMQELSGEITAEELEQKKQRLEILEKKINDQIADLEKML
ncbi:MAG: GTP-binding protein [Promethearchaeota archaeon]|nr:MAG: GTP-binding protein [Candidatus Lokiarchaeota archaeon]